jgi:Tol biopolymer transport system component
VLLNSAGYPDSWSRDGRFIAFGMARLGSYDAYVMEVDKKDQPPVLIVKGSPGVDEPRFSPDGRWIAYHAFGSGGMDQVSVIPYPPTGERWQISGEGGVQPRWSPEGDELFYLDPAGRLMAVAIPGGDPRRAAAPRALFETPLRVSNTFDQFAVASKERFLFRLPFGDDPQVPVNVIVGWDR